VDGDEYSLDFKNYVGAYWKQKEPGFQEKIEELTGKLVDKLRSSLDEPTGDPVTPTGRTSTGTSPSVLPSQLAQQREFLDVYTKIVNVLRSKQDKVDQGVSKALEEYQLRIEGYKDKYKTENNQPSLERGYRYTGPQTLESKKSWYKFIDSHIKPLFSIRSDAHRAMVPSRTMPEHLIREDKLTSITIDFEELRKNELNESFLAMFGGWVEHILGAMFGNTSIPVSVKGNKREVESFAKALGGEKSYIEAARQHGLDHPMTYKNKARLDNAVKGFEKETGLKWPFK